MKLANLQLKKTNTFVRLFALGLLGFFALFLAFYNQTNCIGAIADTSNYCQNLNITITNTSSNYKFTVPSGKAGKYFLNASLNLRDVSQSQTINFARVSIYKNGSEFANNTFNHSGNYGDQYTINVSTIDDASASDYYQVYGTVTTSDSSDGEFLSNGYRSWFCGYKLI